MDKKIIITLLAAICLISCVPSKPTPEQLITKVQNKIEQYRATCTPIELYSDKKNRLLEEILDSGLTWKELNTSKEEIEKLHIKQIKCNSITLFAKMRESGDYSGYSFIVSTLDTYNLDHLQTLDITEEYDRHAHSMSRIHLFKQAFKDYYQNKTPITRQNLKNSFDILVLFDEDITPESPELGLLASEIALLEEVLVQQN